MRDLQSQLALRFLFSGLKGRGLKAFTAVSVLGIALSVFVFLLIQTLILGLGEKTKDSLLGIEAPVVAVGSHQDLLTLQANLLARRIVDRDEVLLVQDFQGLLSFQDKTPFAVLVRAVPKRFFTTQNKIQLWLFDEPFAEQNEEQVSKALSQSWDQLADQVLLGENLLAQLGLVGISEPQLKLMHPFADVGPSGQLEPHQLTVTIKGMFSTDHLETDQSTVLVSPKFMARMAPAVFLENKLFLYPRGDLQNFITQATVFLKASPSVKIITWQERHAQLLKAMSFEKLVFFAVFFFLLMVASVNIAGLIGLFGLAHSKSLAILLSLGLSLQKIKAVFCRIGFLLGFFGALAGILFALVLVSSAQHFDWQLPAAYGFTKLPLRFDWVSASLLFVFSPLLSTLVALLPLWRWKKQSFCDVLRDLG
ncbi:MAG: ABC transporter permease [Deltaproteobacteria bacterium]|nr:ABC transporter permease [Deltaproteobacteria bacterium]